MMRNRPFLTKTINASRNTIAWVEKGGIIGRGVLLDYAAWADAKGIELATTSTTPITASTLKEVAQHQGTTFKAGDILIIRTGWMRAFEKLPEEARHKLADVETNHPSIGVESSEETLRWLWDQSFAAVAGDQPSFEAWPIQNMDYALHVWLLAGWGMPIGEFFDLEKLSKVCQKYQRWSFFFTSVPMKVCLQAPGLSMVRRLTHCV